MTYQAEPDPGPHDPLTAPPYRGPGYGSEPTPQPQQYRLYDQTSEPQYPPVQYPPTVTPHTVPYYPPPREWRNGFGVTALVVGIVSVLFLCTLIPVPLGIVAVIFGVLGLGRARRGEADNRGMAIAGLVMGGVATAVVVAILVMIFLFAVSVSDITY